MSNHKSTPKPATDGRPLQVLIVGAGFCGLAAAIECRLKGMEVTIVETYPTSRNQGDVIDFFGNGGQIIASWDDGKVGEELMKTCIRQNDAFMFYNAKGEYLGREPWHLHPHHAERQFAGHRGEMHELVTNYASKLGVVLNFGETVVDFLDEGVEGVDRQVGVVCKSGRRFMGDVLLCCDGPRSLARQKVLGLDDNKVNSGYAIFRAFFTLTPDMRQNLYMSRFTDPDHDFTGLWVGKDMHGLIYSWNNGQDIAWALTHKDTENIGESWSFPGNKKEVMDYLDEAGFSELWKEVVRLTPDDKIVDYKLVWRAPLETWIPQQPFPRTIVLGDAAHCHLPSSGQGASQSIEDGAAIAVCLDRARGDVPLALRVLERIRFNRQNTIQLTSIANRDQYHNVEWTPEFTREHPDAITMYREDWVLEHDAREHAERHFDQLAEEVRTGKKGNLSDLALPAGGKYSHVPIRV